MTADATTAAQTAARLTPARQRALDAIVDSGATLDSPLRLHGAAFKAGLWLYENDLVGMTSAGFYPPRTVAREADVHALLDCQFLAMDPARFRAACKASGIVGKRADMLRAALKLSIDEKLSLASK